MRPPVQLPSQTRRGLQQVFQRPLAPKAVQQAQGLHIVTSQPPTPAIHVAANSVGPTVQGSLLLRALTHIRNSLTHILPASLTVAAVGKWGPAPLDVAACEAASLESPAEAISSIFTDAAHSDKPLIFSVHNIESYLATRKSDGGSSATSKDRSLGAKSTSVLLRRRSSKSATHMLQSVVRDYVLKPVSSINHKVFETTQQTLGSITAFSAPVSAAEVAATSASSPAARESNWVQLTWKVAAIVIAYDAALLAIAYFACSA